MFNPDEDIDRLIADYDDSIMPLPHIEYDPHILISKVRKHYMEYVIKLLALNYETNQKLLNKNIYLPSAIWRCAKNIEMSAAQTCMVVQLYRKNIVAVIKQLKNDTKKGRLNKKLYECLSVPPENDKKIQASLIKGSDCNCQCVCNQQKKRRKIVSPREVRISDDLVTKSFDMVQVDIETEQMNTVPGQVTQTNQLSNHSKDNESISLPNSSIRIPDQQDTDDLMIQLEKLFQGENNEDDIFDGALCETFDSISCDDSGKNIQNTSHITVTNQESVIENHAAQIKSLDERLASLAGMLENNSEPSTVQQKPEKAKSRNLNTSKWLCEEYYLKKKLFELLDQIRDCNRKKLARIKTIILHLFGNDSDDEDVMSPLEENSEFVISCKERIAPWVVKLLTPYYIKGRIRGKSLFKAVAKHLIRLIYQCSKYPYEYEVSSFVSDFLESHKMIRCQADFKQFRIDNFISVE